MRAFWRGTVAKYELDRHHLLLLQAACEAWDRRGQAKAVLDEQGTSYTDAKGNPRNRPEVAVERDSNITFMRSLRELGLDAASAGGRPPPLISNNRGR